MYASGVCVIEAATLSKCFRRHVQIVTYVLTYLSLPNACLCKVATLLAVRAGQVGLVSQAFPEGKVGSKFLYLHYYFKHVEWMDTFCLLLLIFFVFLNSE